MATVCLLSDRTAPVVNGFEGLVWYLEKPHNVGENKCRIRTAYFTNAIHISAQAHVAFAAPLNIMRYLHKKCFNLPVIKKLY